jgi:predicted nucleic acid-binding protein
MAFLLDTSAINRICDGEVRADAWSPVYITDLVVLELGRTRDANRRHSLFAVLDGRLGPGGILRSEGSVCQDTEGQWGYGERYDAPLPLSIGRPFPLILRAIGTSHRQHWRDAFIVQAAMMNGLTLVTADRKQARAAHGFHVPVEYIE